MRRSLQSPLTDPYRPNASSFTATQEEGRGGEGDVGSEAGVEGRKAVDEDGEREEIRIVVKLRYREKKKIITRQIK